MSENSYITMYKNEIRPVTIQVFSGYSSLTPTSAKIKVYDSDGDVVVNETSASVSSNEISIDINTYVTQIPDKYKILWKIYSGNYEYRHKTILTVENI